MRVYITGKSAEKVSTLQEKLSGLLMEKLQFLNNRSVSFLMLLVISVSLLK
jgi:hypothetical protein